MRRVMIAGTRCTELLGRGDVLRPWAAMNRVLGREEQRHLFYCP